MTEAGLRAPAGVPPSAESGAPGAEPGAVGEGIGGSLSGAFGTHRHDRGVTSWNRRRLLPAAAAIPSSGGVITHIAVDVVQRQHQEALDLERRWRATAGATTP
jgi:hypothetical protein